MAQFKKKSVAVVSSLPPEESGISVFTKSTLAESVLPLEFFSSASNTMPDVGIKKVFSVGALKQRHEEVSYKGVVYVIGNSSHNIDAICLGLDSPVQRFIVCLHDPCLNNIVWQLIEKYPSPFNKYSLSYRYAKFWGRNKFERKATNGLRFWCSQMKRPPEGWIVHSRKAAEFVRDVVGADVPIFELFHPIFEIEPPRAVPVVTKPWKIGHFGMVGPAKRITDLIDVCRRIHDNVEPVRLIFAGYNANIVERHLRPDDNFVEWYKPRSTREFLAIMRSVDLAVQLRRDDLGEASGVIAQLLGQRCHVLASDSSVVQHYGGLLDTVPLDADNEVLSRNLVALLTQPSDRIFRAPLDEFSLGKYQAEFQKILQGLGFLARQN